MPPVPDPRVESGLARLPPQRRADVVLAAAAHAADVLAPHPRAHHQALDALESARQWAAGDLVTARALYEHVHPLLELELLLGASPRSKAALFAVVAALYYCTRLADREAPSTPSLPNDMAEVDDTMAATCLAYALEAADDSPAARAVQIGALQRASGNRTDDPSAARDGP